MWKYLQRDRIVPFLFGLAMTINFAIFWAFPMGGMGSFYKSFLKVYLQPIYLAMESNTLLRKFASTYIYNNPRHADFLPLSILLLINCSITIPTMFYWQLVHGYLPWWLIYAYYCSWVGTGGSMMGAAYGLAHKECHNPKLYKESFKSIFGHVFENTLGPFFGNVPWNFTTSHIRIHHAVNGGLGDTFYLWDFDRSCFWDFMLYVYRVFLHMIGYSSVHYLRANKKTEHADLLQSGVYTYITYAVAILAVTRSPSFVFWFYIQPMFCMTYFLALINIGFHGFLEYDEHGVSIQVINATTIVEGEDDLFGEDDHMAHHYNTGVYFKDLQDHQGSKIEEFKKYRASVFRGFSIMELSIFIIFGLWDKLAEHYVDYTGKMTKEEIIDLLKVRSKRLETTYERYQQYLVNPSLEARKELVHDFKIAQEVAMKKAAGVNDQ